jgi:hypothetical protein
LDSQKFPAKLLAAEYHQRWEVENTIDEFQLNLGKKKLMFALKDQEK